MELTSPGEFHSSAGLPSPSSRPKQRNPRTLLSPPDSCRSPVVISVHIPGSQRAGLPPGSLGLECGSLGPNSFMRNLVIFRRELSTPALCQGLSLRPLVQKGRETPKRHHEPSVGTLSKMLWVRGEYSVQKSPRTPRKRSGSYLGS